MNPTYGYDESLKTVTTAFTPRQSVFFMPMAWTRAENIQYQPKQLVTAFSESTPLSFLVAILKKVTKMKNQIVSFNNHNIELIQHNNQNYMTLSQIASALEYNNCSSINDILSRNKSEFDDDMTCLIKHGRTRVRIFNREGAWLIGMFARTPKAAEFRKWVLKVLGAVADNKITVNSGTVEVAPYTRRMPSAPREIVLSEKAKMEIGGIVKTCTAASVRDELKDVLSKEVKEVIKDQFMDFVMRIFACAEDLKPFQQVTDDMLLRGLYDWYSTRHHKLLDTVKSVTEENSVLKSKIATIKKTVN